MVFTVRELQLADLVVRMDQCSDVTYVRHADYFHYNTTCPVRDLILVSALTHTFRFRLIHAF